MLGRTGRTKADAVMPGYPCGGGDERMRGIRRIMRPGTPPPAPNGARAARAGYVLLGTALLSSPLLLPFALALLMVALRGSPIGSVLLAHLHIVYIASMAYCLAALASAAYLLRGAPADPPAWNVPLTPQRTPDAQHLEFQRWLFAHGRYTADRPPPGADG